MTIFCEHLPLFASILIFRFPGLESYMMRATASYKCEGLVAAALIEPATDHDGLFLTLSDQYCNGWAQ